MIVIKPLEDLVDFHPEDINALLSQLSSHPRSLTKVEIRKIGKLVRFYTARDSENDRIIGMCSIVLYEVPTGLKALIEDVVVDRNYRLKGVGKQLVSEALFEAKSKGAKHVDLTSRPEREGGNMLYQKLGFKKRETNVYRLDLSEFG
jgi:ribosomal protein S18 acetylase RimI-like enzyme